MNSFDACEPAGTVVGVKHLDAAVSADGVGGAAVVRSLLPLLLPSLLLPKPSSIHTSPRATIVVVVAATAVAALNSNSGFKTNVASPAPCENERLQLRHVLGQALRKTDRLRLRCSVLSRIPVTCVRRRARSCLQACWPPSSAQACSPLHCRVEGERLQPSVNIGPRPYP